MTISKPVIVLSLAALLLALVTSVTGVFAHAPAGGPATVVSVYGEEVALYGYGLYANDAHFTAPIFRGTDALMLGLGLPLLLAALMWYTAGDLRGGLLLLGVLTYFFYYGVSMTFGVMQNPLFLLYMGVMSTSLFAMITLMTASVDVQRLPEAVGEGMPHRPLRGFMLVSGVVLLGVWGADLVVMLLTGTPPASLQHYTTSITHALDIAVIVPVLLLVWWWLRQRQPLGYLLTAPMLMLCTLVGLTVLSQTIFQLRAGVPLTAAQVAIYAVSFMALASVSGGLAWAFFRHIQSSAPGHRFRRRSA